MPSVNSENLTPTEHSFDFPDEPLGDDIFGDLLIDNGGFDDDGNWVEGTGEVIGNSTAKSPYGDLLQKFGENAIGLFTEWSITGLSPSDIADPGENKAYAEWLSLIDDATLLNIEGLGKSRAIHKEIYDKILASTPFLLDGRLSPEQEEILQAEHYTLGINQSSTFTLDDAERYLEESNGIDVTPYALDQRFILLNHNHKAEDGVIERAIIDGYYGNPKIGRFIIAIPTNTPRSNPVSSAEGIVDFYLSKGGKRLVNPKYIAGYIDTDGAYYQNYNFTVSSVAEFRHTTKPGV